MVLLHNADRHSINVQPAHVALQRIPDAWPKHLQGRPRGELRIPTSPESVSLAWSAAYDGFGCHYVRARLQQLLHHGLVSDKRSHGQHFCQHVCARSVAWAGSGASHA